MTTPTVTETATTCARPRSRGIPITAPAERWLDHIDDIHDEMNDLINNRTSTGIATCTARGALAGASYAMLSGQCERSSATHDSSQIG